MPTQPNQETEGKVVPDAVDIFAMTDLEEALLHGDRSLTVASLLSRLAHLRAAIDASVQAGLTPNEFERAEAIKSSIAVAQSFIGTLSSAP